jgi:UDP-glucose 4-epimerase
MTLQHPGQEIISPTQGAILVTGISGFIGRHVAASLAAAGYEVIGLTRNTDLPGETAGLCSRVIVGDLRQPTALKEALEGVAGVCHLAAYLPSDYADPSEAEACLSVNALGTLELARAALRSGVQRMVYASTASAYLPTSEPLTEGAVVSPTGHAAWYQTSKVAGEFYLERLRDSDALSPVILRIASCYGPGMEARSVLARFVARAQHGEPLDVFHGGRARADFVHVLDVAQCFVSALSAGESGVYNVGSGCATTLLELAKAVKVALGSSSPVRVLDADNSVPTGWPPLSIAKAAAAWGYAPMSLESGLATFAASS